MWWTKSYVNRRDWILENLGVLKLTPSQTIVLLMIDFMNSNNLEITMETLSERLSMDVSEVDGIIQNLAKSNVLVIRVEEGKVVFSMDALFQDGLLYEFVNATIFEVFESEFGRLLSQNELQTLNTWLKNYTEDEILDALRTSIVYQKQSMQYINSVLVNKRKERV